jgi:hypothetical protein
LVEQQLDVFQVDGLEALVTQRQISASIVRASSPFLA